MELAFLLLTLLFGSIIQGMTGFGFGLFSVGLLSLFLPLPIVTTLLFALTTVLSSNLLLKLWRHVVWKELIYILLGGLLGRAVGYWFLSTFSEAQWMRMLLGIILISIVLYNLFSKKLNLTRLEKLNDRSVALLLGGMAGFVGGVFAAGGPFLVIYFMMRSQDKNQYHAHLQVALMVMNLFSILLNGLSSQWNQELLIYFIVGIVAVTAGSAIGLRLFGRIPHNIVIRVTYAIILLVGIQLLLSS